MPFNSSNVYTTDTVVSDVPGTRKAVVNHFMSIWGLNGLDATAWNSVRYAFWNDGGEADAEGFVALLSNHVISLKNIIMRIMIGQNQTASSVTEYTLFEEANLRIVEYKKNEMDQWVVSSTLLSNYGNYSPEHDCVITHGGFENYLFKSGCAYELQLRLHTANIGALGTGGGTVSFTCDLYESF